MAEEEEVADATVVMVKAVKDAVVASSVSFGMVSYSVVAKASFMSSYSGSLAPMVASQSSGVSGE